MLTEEYIARAYAEDAEAGAAFSAALTDYRAAWPCIGAARSEATAAFICAVRRTLDDLLTSDAPTPIANLEAALAALDAKATDIADTNT